MSTCVVYTDYYYDSVEEEFAILRTLPDIQIVDLTKISPGGITAPAELIKHVGEADALITQFATIDAGVMDAMPKCKIIARHAIGVDAIDVEAASNRGIKVANVPDYCIEEVSDTAMAHILNGTRRLSEADALLRRGHWSYSAISPLTRISNLTCGLLAFGNIARRVAEKLRPFGCRVIAHDPYIARDENYSWIDFVDRETLFGESDVLSIHTPLNSQTKHTIDAKAFSAMKTGVVLVNTSRGGVIDQAALAAAIKNGRVRYAGLDVLEEPDADYGKSPILQLGERVLVTPHLGWYSEQSIQELKAKTARNVVSLFQTGKPIYSVN